MSGAELSFRSSLYVFIITRVFNNFYDFFFFTEAKSENLWSGVKWSHTVPGQLSICDLLIDRHNFLWSFGVKLKLTYIVC